MAITAADRQAFNAAYLAAKDEVDGAEDFTQQDIDDLRLANGRRAVVRHWVAVARALRSIGLVQ